MPEAVIVATARAVAVLAGMDRLPGTIVCVGGGMGMTMVIERLS